MEYNAGGCVAGLSMSSLILTPCSLAFGTLLIRAGI